MRQCRKRVYVCQVAALILCLAFAAAQAAGQALTEEDLRLLETLTPDERAELLRAFGRAPSGGEVVVERDVSDPQTVEPREQLESDAEEELSGIEEPAPASGPPVPPPLEPLTEETVEIKRAFLNFVEESLPLEVDQDLEQFGYELFAGVPTTFAPATDIPVSADYIIGPGDEIRIQLYGKTSLASDLIVDRDGIISFPELGPITVAGLTFREMKELVSREVGHRMIGNEVSVSMGRLRSIRVLVLGEVFRPGSYTISGLSTLTNALFTCGGVQKIGSLRQVQLKRAGEIIEEMDLYDLLIDGNTSSDVRLMPSDVIFVPPVGPLVGIAGEVLRPAIYEMKEPMTARELIQLAGGLRPTAFRDLIQLERIEDGRRVTYDMGIDGAHEWMVQSGDLLKIYSIIERDEHAVFLEGNVLRPGKRQYFEGMRLLDLVPSLTDLLPETHFDYGLIERESVLNREPEYIGFNLGAALIDGRIDANLLLAPRDRIYVFHRAHFREVPRVSVRGEVRSPGVYEHKKDMRVLDLILAAGGLTRDAWLDEAELLRTDPSTLRVEKISIDLSRVLADDGPDNLALKDLDELAVHSIWEFRRRDEVKILGEVNEPGNYPLFEGMRISDLVFCGGSLKETAYREEAELTRYEIVDGERRELHHVVVNLNAALEGSGDADLELQTYDRLLIRRISNWRGDEVVEVAGEVAFPGRYPIEEGERLSDLIERFGGFLENAYLPAAVFTRSDVRTRQQEELERMADQLESDLTRLSVASSRGASAGDVARRQAALETGAQLAAELRKASATGRMVIGLETSGRLRGTDKDVVLTDGDRLYVPKKPDFVMVMGQVNNPTAFQFERGKRASYYIRLAGGSTRFGDRGKTYVVKADGAVERRRGARIDPGDVIVVPETLERFAGMQFLLDISQVLYQIGIAAASAYTVGLFD
jgi:polysaccharide export outer membrane protein